MGQATRKHLPQAPARWNHQKWGTLEDPIHKSDLSDMVGEYGCTESFARKKRATLAGDVREVTTHKAVGGTAVHEVLARVLRSPAAWRPVLQAGATFPPEQVRRALREEWDRASEGMEVLAGKDDPAKLFEERAQMVEGCLALMSRHVAEPLLSEAGYIAPFGDYWLEGHVDLVYRPVSSPKGIAFTDWKTGAQKPSQITLDHGYESGFYSLAMRDGAFVPEQVVREIRAQASMHPDGGGLHGFSYADCVDIRSAPSQRHGMHAALRRVGRGMRASEELPECVVRFGQFPDEIRLTHLADFVPYSRKGGKAVSRPEELEHFGLTEPGKVAYEKGHRRGPGWYRVRRSEADIPRLEHLLRGVVGWIRFGRFVKAIGDKCTRCGFRRDCLTEGYELRGDELADVNQALRGLDLGDDLDGLDDL